ncbi:hypothetical protein GCM10010988_40420 [Cnuibacter physcomitrellae]|uniref:Uncharacterized protein n=1 Tax=Cnuibacter physcomitrellae TaxID=1619308 RepID=A0A1X9LZZ3_9MICO|nr:hypothetical protein [Cnuibacter physcomitrellae]ARJ07640.1 hypothetical protein B5808_19880 [Cnuibacter physcomitrellae]GGI42714.1 hypothetical protein GCM10010988_40420 [Cnuibacter physcomitrellae]
MSIDLAALSLEQLEIYVAGYADALDAHEHDTRVMQQLTDDALADLAHAQAELAQALADVELFYRIAFSPRPDARPVVSRQELEVRRQKMARSSAAHAVTDWPDARVRRPAA